MTLLAKCDQMFRIILPRQFLLACIFAYMVLSVMHAEFLTASAVSTFMTVAFYNFISYSEPLRMFEQSEVSVIHNALQLICLSLELVHLCVAEPGDNRHPPHIHILLNIVAS